MNGQTVLGDIRVTDCEPIQIFLEPERASKLRMLALVHRKRVGRYAGEFIRAVIDDGSIATTSAPPKTKKNRVGHHTNAANRKTG